MSKRQQKLEKKRSQAIWFYFEDGIWEFYFGLSAILIGLMIRFELSILFLLLLVPLIILPLALKWQLTLPRLKKIKINTGKRKAVWLMGAILLSANILLVFVMKSYAAEADTLTYIGENILVIGAMVIGSLTWFLAYAFAFRRLYSYGLLMFLGVFLEAWLFAAAPLGLEALAGLIIIGFGVSILTPFLKNHPAAN